MAVVALAAALTLPVGLHAHTVDQLEAWDKAWEAQAAAQGYVLSEEMMSTRLDIRQRHPWFYDPEPEVRVAARLIVAPPPPRPPSLGVEQWRAMVAHFWPAEHVDRMLRIMQCESGGRADAKNPRSSATGLFQIMAFWQKTWPGDYTDPWTNAAVAYQIWLSQGLPAWAASRGCWG